MPLRGVRRRGGRLSHVPAARRGRVPRVPVLISLIIIVVVGVPRLLSIYEASSKHLLLVYRHTRLKGALVSQLHFRQGCWRTSGDNKSVAALPRLL